MSDERLTLTEIQYRRLFPWLIIFRCFKLAADPKKILLALVGVMVFGVGWQALNIAFANSVFSAGADSDSEATLIQVGTGVMPWEPRSSASRIWSAYGGEEGRSPLQTLPRALEDPPRFLVGIATRWSVPLTPFFYLTQPFKGMFVNEYPSSRLAISIPWADARIDAGYMAYLLTMAIWAAICWGIFGGAISRIAAMQLARDERVTLREALSYSLKYAASLISAPFIPLLGAALFTAFCLVGGWISNIPGFGPFFASVLWFLPLIAGLIMALLIVGWAVGWPLMIPTLAVEATDAFDAVSRAYAYSYQRPWNYLFYGALTIVYGSIATFIYLVFAQLTLYLSVWAVSWGASNQLLADLAATLPGYADRLLMIPYQASEQTPEYMRAASLIFTFWVTTVVLTGPAFVYSFFWSAATAIYLLLRRDVDATDIDEIWTEEEMEESFLTAHTLETQAPAAEVGAGTAEAGATTSDSPAGEGAVQEQGAAGEESQQSGGGEETAGGESEEKQQG